MSVAEFPPGAQDAIDRVGLEESRAYCGHVTRIAAKNFYYGLKLLPEPKRSAMFALYAYMRLVDDIADDDDGRSLERRAADLDVWRVRTHSALKGRASAKDHPLWPAFAETARRYQLDVRLFDDAIAGQRQDLAPVTFEKFAELETYCYRVAGVVGLASIKIWGYEGGEPTEDMAIARGVAFQVTNVLRDLREDAARGRIYLPIEDLTAVDLTPADILAGRGGANFIRLVRLEIERVESFYEKSAQLESRLSTDSRATMVAMTEIYRGLLRKIADDPERVLRERVSLSLLSKLRIGWRATRDIRRRLRARAGVGGELRVR